MPTVSFTGLASGFDSSSLVSQLVAVAKQPAKLLTSQQSDLATKKTVVDNLTSALGSFGDLVGSMKLDTDLQYRTASATDAHVSVAASGSALAANHDVRVLSLAAAQVSSSRQFDADSIDTAGSLTIGTKPAIAWAANDSLDSIAQKINDAGAGVTASVLFDGSKYQIVTVASKTGTANAPAVTDNGLGLAVKVPAADASMMIDGTKVTRPTNVFDDVYPGLTFTAASVPAASDPDTTVSVGVDRDAITEQLQSFVSKFNGIIGGLHEQLDYTGTTKGTNTLFGDSTLQGLQSQMMTFAVGNYGGMSLADLGLTIDKTGAMSLDTDKLGSALDANPNALSSLFVGGGFASAFTGMTDAYTRPGDGLLVTESKGFSDQSTALQDQIDTINTAGDALQQRLQDEFNQLEQTMSKLNSQSSYIAKLLAT